MAYPIAKRAIYAVIRPWIKEIKGKENIPQHGPFIVSANHSSYLDHLIIATLIMGRLNQKLHFLAKKEHFDNYFEGAWHNYAGAIPLDRQAGGKKALKWAIKALRQGGIIGIYPEGTRTLTGKLQEAKTGVARLALEARVPVLPIGLKGTFHILPKGKFIPRLARATVSIGKPIFLDRYYGSRYSKKVLRQATNKIMREIAKLSGQNYNFK